MHLHGRDKQKTAGKTLSTNNEIFKKHPQLPSPPSTTLIHTLTGCIQSELTRW